MFGHVTSIRSSSVMPRHSPPPCPQKPRGGSHSLCPPCATQGTLTRCASSLGGVPGGAGEAGGGENAPPGSRLALTHEAFPVRGLLSHGLPGTAARSRRSRGPAGGGRPQPAFSRSQGHLPAGLAHSAARCHLTRVSFFWWHSWVQAVTQGGRKTPSGRPNSSGCHRGTEACGNL